VNAFIYQADIYCEHCGQKIRDTLTAKGKHPVNQDNESSYDSDDFPKGPYPNGGGEADSPQHCANCHVFLGNDLTGEGVAYVFEALQDYVSGMGGKADVLDEWSEHVKCSSNDEFETFILVAFEAVRSLEEKLEATL
jgi:hypothetical protein